MAEIIFIVMVIAAIVVIGIAWTFALRRNRLGISWMARTGRRTTGPIPMNLSENQRRDSSTISDR